MTSGQIGRVVSKAVCVAVLMFSHGAGSAWASTVDDLVNQATTTRPRSEAKPTPTGSSVDDIVAEAERISNPEKPFELTLRTKGGKTLYNVGELISFECVVNADCYLTLFTVDRNNRTLDILFPNVWHKSHRVKKGETIVIPPEGSQFRFRIAGPAGTDYVKAFVSLEPMETKLAQVVNQKLQSNEQFASIGNPKAILSELQAKLAKMDRKKWAETKISFQVQQKEKNETKVQ